MNVGDSYSDVLEPVELGTDCTQEFFFVCHLQVVNHPDIQAEVKYKCLFNAQMPSCSVSMDNRISPIHFWTFSSS